MKKKPVWMGCLLVALVSFIILVRRIDAMMFNGLRVLSEDRLRQMTVDLSEMDNLQGAEWLLELDGQRIPYDRDENIFYVSQSTKVAEYAGTFSAVREDCAVYIQEDAALHDKQTAIEQGHVFRVWFVTEEAYGVSDLIFTGLPMVCIYSDEGKLSDDYGRGDIVVQNPDDNDVITMSVKHSAIMVKTDHHSGTISFKLYKKGYSEERNLQLLGLGKRTSWKLYPVHDKDDSAVREMLAAYVWNCVCETESFQKSMMYAEVIVDGKYKGLYYLAPKTGKSYLGLGIEDRAYKLEERLEDGAKVYEVIGDTDDKENRLALAEYEELWESENHDLDVIDIGKYIDYQIWLQTVCGVRNNTEEYIIVAQKNGESYEFCIVPGRSKFVFGIYPPAIGWQSLTAAEAIVEDESYERLKAELGDILCEETADRWRELRGGVLSTDVMQQYLWQCERELIESGYIARTTGKEEYEAACRKLREFLILRMNYLDSYFDRLS